MKIRFFILSIFICYGLSLFGQKTAVSIVGNKFYVNGKPTYKGISYKGYTVEGLLMNARLVQGVFDDENPETRELFVYPDTKKWDADRNNTEFVANMASWKRHGLLAFTLNLQGGSPFGYGNKPIINSAFTKNGGLKDAYFERLNKILKKADDLGMVVILGLFYFGQDQNIDNEEGVKNAVNNTINWLHERNYKNVIIEIANEGNHPDYNHEIIHPKRVAELINLVKNNKKNNHTYLTGTSFTGKAVPNNEVLEVSDLIFLHGNGAKNTSQIQKQIDTLKTREKYRNIPIVNNEDDHFDFEKEDNNFLTSLKNYVSWGYFDFRFKGETDLKEGFQSVPVNWGISSARKKGFFKLLAEVTASKPFIVPKNISKKDLIKIEVESTKSPLGLWVKSNPASENFISGASNNTYLEFAGNNPEMGPPTSVLEYHFVAPETATYRLVMMTSKRLEGLPGDKCNDAYVALEGDFTSASTLNLQNLKDFNKFFQEGSTKTPEKEWHWAYRAETGRHVFHQVSYNLKKGENYTLKLAGRSQRFSADYILLFNEDKYDFEQIKKYVSK